MKRLTKKRTNLPMNREELIRKIEALRDHEKERRENFKTLTASQRNKILPDIVETMEEANEFLERGNTLPKHQTEYLKGLNIRIKMGKLRAQKTKDQLTADEIKFIEEKWANEFKAKTMRGLNIELNPDIKTKSIKKSLFSGKKIGLIAGAVLGAGYVVNKLTTQREPVSVDKRTRSNMTPPESPPITPRVSPLDTRLPAYSTKERVNLNRVDPWGPHKAWKNRTNHHKG